MAFFRKRLSEYVPRSRPAPKKKKKKKASGKKRVAKKRATVPGSPVLSSATDRYLARYQEKFGGTRAAAREALATMLYGASKPTAADASPSKGTPKKKKKKKRTAKKRAAKNRTAKKATRKKKRAPKKRKANKKAKRKKKAKRSNPAVAVKGDGVNSRAVHLRPGESYRWSLRFDGVASKAIREKLLARLRKAGTEVNHAGLDPLIASVLVAQKKRDVVRTNVRKKLLMAGAPDLTQTTENVWHV